MKRCSTQATLDEREPDVPLWRGSALIKHRPSVTEYFSRRPDRARLWPQQVTERGVATPLVPWRSKLRALQDRELPRSESPDDFWPLPWEKYSRTLKPELRLLIVWQQRAGSAFRRRLKRPWEVVRSRQRHKNLKSPLRQFVSWCVRLCSSKHPCASLGSGHVSSRSAELNYIYLFIIRSYFKS